MNELILEKLKSAFPSSIEATNDFRGDLTVQVKKSDVVTVGEFLKNDAELSFDLPVDVVGVDMYRPEGRFEVVYVLYSIKNRKYLRLKVLVDGGDAVTPTLSTVWSGAAWCEREVYDMIGVKFSGHPDLRRMYMPEEFEYHPLRKDFPLLGIPDSLPLPRK
jgi:NADH-quinone oxidoreductase subunit C